MTTAATAFELPRTGLVRAIDRISFCISRDKTRPQLCGMLLEAADAPGSIRFVATDGHRLGYAEVPVLDGSLPAPGVMIPPKAVAKLFEKLSTLAEAAATVSIEAGSMKVRCGRACVGTKLVAETFPDYRARVLALRGNTKDVVVDAGDLFDAVFSTVGDEHRRVALKIQKGRIIIPSTDDDGAVSVSCTTPKNWKPLTIGFNRNYLLDVLDGLRGIDVTLNLVSPKHPMSFEAAGIEGLLYIVMPMRL